MEYSRKRSESQWETIPDPRANHGEGPALRGGSRAYERMDYEGGHTQVVGTPSAKGKPTKVREVGRGLMSGLLGSTKLIQPP